MGIDFRVIWVVDFNNTTIFYVRLPTRRPRATHRPPSHQIAKKMTNLSLWVSILRLFGQLNSIMLLDFTSAAAPPAVTPKFKDNQTNGRISRKFTFIYISHDDCNL